MVAGGSVSQRVEVKLEGLVWLVEQRFALSYYLFLFMKGI